MKSMWKTITDLADLRVAESFKPFGGPPPDQEEKMGLWLANTQITPLWATEWRCRKGWSVGPRTMAYCVWWVFPDNKGWIRLLRENETLKFSPGDLILMPEGIEHVVGLTGRGQMRQFAGHFQVNVFGSLNLLKLAGFPILVKTSKDAPFYAAARHMIREYAVKAAGWQNAMAVEVLNILLYIIRKRSHLFNPVSFGCAKETLRQVSPFLEKIENNISNPNFSSCQLIKKSGVSEVYLRKLFKTATGMCPATFIQRQRVNKACNLLQHSNMEIKEIVTQCGFTGLNFFYRAFKHWTNATPLQFRGNATY